MKQAEFDTDVVTRSKKGKQSLICQDLFLLYNIVKAAVRVTVVGNDCNRQNSIFFIFPQE